MVLYTCEICCFVSKHTTNYEKHCLTRKHLRSLDKIENEKSKVFDNKHQPTIKHDNTKVTFEVTQSNTKSEIDCQYICEFCNKKFKHSNSYYRHCKHYCIKVKDSFVEIQKLKNEVQILKDSIHNKPTTNTTNNNINISYIKNDKVLNYLNSNFPEAIEMDSFITRLKNYTSLPREMMDCFVMCYNNGGTDSFGSTLVKYLNQICKQLDINIFPLCCSDTNLRSHKEKNNVGWETVIDTTKIEDIIHHLIKNIFLETGDMIHLDAKERKKICNIVKKSYGLSSIEMIENLETNTNEIYIPIGEDISL